MWGEVADNSGKRLVSRLQCPEGYTLTALTALAIAQKVLAGVGFQTLSLVYGADFILEIEGVVREDLDSHITTLEEFTHTEQRHGGGCGFRSRWR